jgi:hypothetical protein
MILDEYVYPWCATSTAPQKHMELIIINVKSRNHDAYSHVVMFSTLLLLSRVRGKNKIMVLDRMIGFIDPSLYNYT